MRDPLSSSSSITILKCCLDRESKRKTAMEAFEKTRCQRSCFTQLRLLSRDLHVYASHLAQECTLQSHPNKDEHETSTTLALMTPVDRPGLSTSVKQQLFSASDIKIIIKIFKPKNNLRRSMKPTLLPVKLTQRAIFSFLASDSQDRITPISGVERIPAYLM
ncbi:hypothetical protein R6Q59_034171 [Mikania micrantha]